MVRIPSPGFLASLGIRPAPSSRPRNEAATRVTPARQMRYNGASEEVPMRFVPIGPEFAAAVEGIDLRVPLDAAAMAAFHGGMDRHGVLVVHDQPFSDEQQIAFTKGLGTIELNTANNVTRL